MGAEVAVFFGGGCLEFWDAGLSGGLGDVVVGGSWRVGGLEGWWSGGLGGLVVWRAGGLEV